MPATRLGKFLRAMRESAHLNRHKPDADPRFRRLMKDHPDEELSRREALNWYVEIHGDSEARRQRKSDFSASQLARWEQKESRPPAPHVIDNLLIVYGLSPAERLFARDYLDQRTAGRNPHLIDWRMRHLAIAEYGPNARTAYKIGDFASAWREVEKSRPGGFVAGEVTGIVEDRVVEPPPQFIDFARRAKEENERRRAANVHAWSDNPTLCLDSITADILPGRDERRVISLHLLKSWYRYNVAAKRESAALFRYRALQDASSPPEPVSFLASGVGICVALICDGGSTFIAGRRSTRETFRKGEYDVAVVEGLHPDKDVEAGRIDVDRFARRAVHEEMGLRVAEAIKRLSVFEIGCDLEYYQWNLLAFAEIDLSFDEAYASWESASDRWETDIFPLSCTKERILEFVTGNPIWSAGAACALRQFEHRNP